MHRSCMCSYLNIDDPYHVCKKLNIVTLNFLISRSMISDDDINSRVVAHFPQNSKDGRIAKTFLQKQRAMHRSILRHPFTTHPIRNAFTGIHFGSWSAGIVPEHVVSPRLSPFHSHPIEFTAIVAVKKGHSFTKPITTIQTAHRMTFTEYAFYFITEVYLKTQALQTDTA